MAGGEHGRGPDPQTPGSRHTVTVSPEPRDSPRTRGHRGMKIAGVSPGKLQSRGKTDPSEDTRPEHSTCCKGTEWISKSEGTRAGRR